MRLNIHPATAVGDDIHGIAQLERIQHGELHAVIRRQAQHNQLGDLMVAQPRVQRRLLTMTVIKERAVAVDGWVFTFVEHRVDGLLVQQRMQLSAFRLLHAVIGPEGLRQPVQFALAVRLNVVLAGKAAVVCRMPVLTRHHRFTTSFTPLNQRIRDVYGAVAFRDGQRTARTEIILQIDQ